MRKIFLNLKKNSHFALYIPTLSYEAGILRTVINYLSLAALCLRPVVERQLSNLNGSC